MECQKHGFVWEDYIREQVFGIKTKFKYTEKWDIPKEHNKHSNSENISIKVSGSKTIDMADPIRIFEQTDDDVNTCITIFYTQRDNRKEITRIVELYLNDISALFGDVTHDDLIAFRDAVKSFPNHTRLKHDTETKERLTNMAETLNAKTYGGLIFNRKIDSKTQRRIQCSIPNFDTFISKHPHLCISDTDQPVVREIVLPKCIVSPRRMFHPTRVFRNSVASCFDKLRGPVVFVGKICV